MSLFFLLLCLLLLVTDECFMALQILAHDLDTLMGPCTPVRLCLSTDVIILTGEGSVMQRSQWSSYLHVACLKAWIGSLWQCSCKKVIWTIAQTVLARASASIKTENIMSVFCNIRFHNNKGGTGPQPQFEHTWWVLFRYCVALRICLWSMFKETCRYQWVRLRIIGLWPKWRSKPWVLCAGGHRCLGSAHPGPHIVFL